MVLTETRKKLAAELFEIGGIRFGAFRLKLHEKNPDAPLSPIYVDLRIVRSFPAAMRSTVEAYRELTQGLKFDVYADIPTAATPIVAVLSHLTGVPMITPRRDDKKYGMKRPIDGAFREGQTALLIDDLITKADSKLETIEVLQENGLTVKDVLVLIDREQGGPEELAKRGYACHAGFKLSELLQYYLEAGKIDKDLYQRTVDYLAGV